MAIHCFYCTYYRNCLCNLSSCVRLILSVSGCTIIEFYYIPLIFCFFFLYSWLNSIKLFVICLIESLRCSLIAFVTVKLFFNSLFPLYSRLSSFSVCVQSVQSMGNTKARKLYEANLPDSFRRPQTDQYPTPSASPCVCVYLCVSDARYLVQSRLSQWPPDASLLFFLFHLLVCIVHQFLFFCRHVSSILVIEPAAFWPGVQFSNHQTTAALNKFPFKVLSSNVS